MVQYSRYHQLKKVAVRSEKGDLESQADTPTRTLILEFGNGAYFKRAKPKLIPLLFFFTFVSCVLIFLPRLMSLYNLMVEYDGLSANGGAKEPLCTSVPSGSICCDRSSIRSDICFMKGDVRTNSASSSLLLIDDVPLSNQTKQGDKLVDEKIRPYTRKWEASVMGTIDELDLIVKKKGSVVPKQCDVRHSVPAVVFSTGGYTGNVYHEFNDGLIPLYVTSQHLNKNVVFVILEYHDWWMMKYGDVVSQLSSHPVIDFSNDKRTHCFPEAIVGLRIHDELTINSSLMHDNKSVRDFRNVLDKAYWPRIQGLMEAEAEAQAQAQTPSLQAPSKKLIKKSKLVRFGEQFKKPKLVILSRNGSRAIINQNSMVELAEEIGFEVEVVKPEKTSEMAKMYRVLNSSDAMIGVHGAAMTHFLFMKPGSVFIQVIPLGTDWAAETYYGEPSRKLGLKYIGYKILPRESSLYKKYDERDPVLRDPESVNEKGWEFTKRIYLDGQNVDLDLERFKRRLVRAYNYTISRRKLGHS